MTSSTVTLCRCGHAAGRHSDDEGCDRGECGCAGFRPGRVETVAPPVSSPTVSSRPPAAPPRTVVRPSAPVIPRVDSAPTIEQIIAAGERSDSQRIRTMAERVRGQVDALRAAIAKERTDAEAKRRAAAEKEAAERRRTAEHETARRRVAELERELATERAKLRGVRTPPQQQGRSSHRRARLYPSRVRPDVRHRTGPRDARAPRARRLRPRRGARGEGRVTA